MKYDSIDLMQLYASGDTKRWNNYLTLQMSKLNIEELVRTRYRLQLGMSELSKKKLNTEEINIWYFRLIHSLEKTAKNILKIKVNNPCNDPLIAKQFSKFKNDKKKLEAEFEAYLRKKSY